MDHLIRQSDLIPSNVLGQEITVIGAGAIGSFTVLSLAKMGFWNITVYDFDKVSVENMNCQWFRFSDIGKPKAQALAELIFDFTKLQIKAFSTCYNGSQELRGIVISSVDSMEVRKLIWSKAKDNFRVSWIIDPRMASEYALSYVMDPNDFKDQTAYEKTLYTDENAIHEPCTSKATIYTATMISGHVAKHVKDLVTGKKYARVTNWDIALNKQLTWVKPQEEINGSR
jgi:hypothetical protein